MYILWMGHHSRKQRTKVGGLIHHKEPRCNRKIKSNAAEAMQAVLLDRDIDALRVKMRCVQRYNKGTLLDLCTANLSQAKCMNTALLTSERKSVDSKVLHSSLSPFASGLW